MIERKLIATLPDGSTKEFELVRPVHTLGRDQSCDIAIAHGSLSRKHAKVLITESSCLLTDLASRNGTYRNGKRIHGEIELSDGAEFRCGSITFRYEDGTSQVAASQTEEEKQNLGSIFKSDLELAEKFRQSSKLLNYGVLLPKLNWKLRMYVMVVSCVVAATILLLWSAKGGQMRQEEQRIGTLMKAFALENRVVFDQDLPLYENLAVRDEPGVVDSYLLDKEGYPVFPPGKGSRQVEGFGGRPLKSILVPSKFPRADGKSEYVFPVDTGGRIQGYAVATFDPIVRRASSYTSMSIILGGVLMLVLGFAALMLATRVISKPLQNLEEEIGLMMGGQTAQLSSYAGFPELNAVVKTVYLLILRMQAGRN